MWVGGGGRGARGEEECGEENLERRKNGIKVGKSLVILPILYLGTWVLG